MKIKNALFIALGGISLALGAVGVVLPILPTVPFLMLAAFCFVKSSEKLHRWFLSTKLYRNNLESFVQGRGMTVQTKLKIMGTVTLLMLIGFMLMARVPVARAILAVVWVCHVVYFAFSVKTIRSDDPEECETECHTEALPCEKGSDQV